MAESSSVAVGVTKRPTRSGASVPLHRRLEIMKHIICEKENSQIIPLSARNAFQRVKLTRIYELLVVLRILLTLNLQTGWIHQDEFANSLEVVAGT
jgi:hypothetical protein